MSRQRQYEVKANPYNIAKGIVRGALVFDKPDLTFKVGGNLFRNTATILRYRQTPIVACRLHEGQAKVSLNLLDKDGQPLLKVVDNDIEFRVTDLWDFEYAHNFAIARYGPREIALRVDLRDKEAKIEGKIWLPGGQVTLGPDMLSLPRARSGMGMGSCIFEGLKVGIQVGEPGPNAGATAVWVEE